jgi:hypothetical protein
MLEHMRGSFIQILSIRTKDKTKEPCFDRNT